MSDDGPSPLSGNGAVLYQLGKVEGKLDAVLAGQSAQAEVNATNIREHDEFRRTDTEHAKMLAVLMDNKEEAREGKRQTVQKWLAYLAIPTALLGSFASYFLGQINHP